MQIKLLKFTVIHNGVSYTAGSIMELPEEKANEFLSEGLATVVEQTMQTAAKPELSTVDFDAMTVSELRKYCNDNGIAIGKAKRKAELLKLVNAGDCDSECSLPVVDYKAVMI